MFLRFHCLVFSCVLGGWEKQKENRERTKGGERICVFNSLSRSVDFFSIERHKN